MPHIRRVIKMSKLMVKLTIVVVMAASAVTAQTINVPGDYTTIQEAINNCPAGGTVVIDPGIYGGTGNRNLLLGAQAITVTSTDPGNPDVVANTVIDCEKAGRAFQVTNPVSLEALAAGSSQIVIAGLTMINGNGGPGSMLGGAIYIAYNRDLVLSNCVISDSSASLGGAIAISNSSPVIDNCRILANSALIGGGALYMTGSSATIEGCILAGNFAGRGGAIYAHNPGSPLLSQCTIAENEAQTYGGAIYCFNASNMVLNGCILSSNTAGTAVNQIQVGGIGPQTTVGISYCDIGAMAAQVVAYAPSSVNWGAGNIDADPMFVEAGLVDAGGVFTEGDYSLLEGSPCIDMGDPAYVVLEGQTDVYGKQRLFGSVVDIGAAEFVVDEVEVLRADVRLWPKVINMRGGQNWMFAIIKVKGHDARDIDGDSIRLSHEGIELEPGNVRKFRGAREVFATFKMDEIRELVADVETDTVTLKVTGTVQDGLKAFEGSDTLKIYDRKHCGKVKSDNDDGKDNKSKENDNGKNKENDKKSGEKKHGK
jgi:hypothetical protein